MSPIEGPDRDRSGDDSGRKKRQNHGQRRHSAQARRMTMAMFDPVGSSTNFRALLHDSFTKTTFEQKCSDSGCFVQDPLLTCW
jgi:hypothetical protein